MQHNPRLLPLLAAVATARADGRTFAAISGLDELDAALALAHLRDEGLVALLPDMALTSAGLAYARARLWDMRHLIAAAGLREVAA